MFSSFSQESKIKLLLMVALVINVSFWFSFRDVKGRWINVPPAPDVKYADSYGLGDRSFAYRLNGIMIQNLGDTGGRSTSLKDYNYHALTKWFYLQDHLDPTSDFIPYLASFYFGGVQEPELFRPVLDYLSEVGSRADGQKWRWLAQGVYLARYKMEDIDRALELANILANTKNENAPSWVRRMPAFIMTAKGEKQAAYALLLEILRTSAEDLHPNEVNATRAYICMRILSEEEAAANPLCENLL